MSENMFDNSQEKRLGIIAGGGQFPRLIAEEAKKNGYYVAICGFRDNTDPTLAESCDDFSILALGQLSKLLSFFKEKNIQRVCMAGSINKPKALDLRPDWRATKLIFSLKTKGDDALLRAILGEFEKDGFTPLSAVELLPSLRTPCGNLTEEMIIDTIQADITFALPIAKQLGNFDIGQCLVVREGMVIAVECIEGTDATLARAADLGGLGCIAIKLAKQRQDQRVDLPSIGLTTIENLIKYKYTALVIEEHKTLFFDREKALDLAKKNNLHIIALNPNTDIKEILTSYKP